MKNWLFCCCLLVGSVSFSSLFAFRFLSEIPGHWISLETPIILPEPAEDEAHLLHTFFNRFLLDEDVRQEMVEVALNKGLTAKDTNALLRLLFIRFSFIGDQLDQAVMRANTLRNAGVDPFSAFARALYEGVGLTASASASRVMHLLTQATLMHDVEAAFWTDIFQRYGLTEAQALSAFHAMKAYLKKPFNYWHAFWRAMASSFRLNESVISRLNAYQIGLVNNGVSSRLAFNRALFFVLGSNGAHQAQLVSQLNARLEADEPIVAAYYAIRFRSAGLSEDATERALERLMYIFEHETCPFCLERAYTLALYDAFGFSQALARTMVEINDSYLSYPQADPFYTFWSAAFRVVGIPEARLADANQYFSGYLSQGFSAREAFELSYIRMFVGADEAQSVIQNFLTGDTIGQGHYGRLRHLIFVVWKYQHSGVAESVLKSVIQGFLESPSSLIEIGSSLSRSVEGN